MPTYPRKLNRDLLIAGGLEVTGNSTLTGTVTVTGAQTFTGAPTFAGQITANAGVAETVQTLTGAACARPGTTAGTPLLGYGVSVVAVTKADATGAANFDLRLNPPVAPGVHKYIFLSHTGASTFETKVMPSATTTVLFWGTTANAINMTTDWLSPVTAGFHLVGVTTQWAVVGANLASTQWSISGATFGTT